MNRVRGFTLIESIIVMVVMAIAMVTFIQFLVPQIANSGDPHYQSRAAALGQSVMTKVLARKFDQNSDNLGGAIRCSSVDVDSVPCTGLSGTAKLGRDTVDGVEEVEAVFNDVDDYIGCWTANSSGGCQDLYQLISDGEDSAYHNFRVDIDAAYETNTAQKMVKKVTFTITAGKHSPIKYVAYRGNF